jgi:peptidoglycan/LPS O-acetylase OafA/YrhL
MTLTTTRELRPATRDVRPAPRPPLTETKTKTESDGTERRASRTSSRDRYIDVLRAAALVRVVLNHAFGWVWLTFVFPSMGIMFALAGSLAAASIDRSPHKPWAFMASRTRRLVPSLWALGLVMVPLMLWHGWAVLHSPADLGTLAYWVLPISDPPYGEWGAAYAEPLWYIRAYLWFVLLSPAALWMFRRWPKRMLALPLGVATLHGLGLINLYGASARTSNIKVDLATYGACWMLGFAHHDGMLKRIPAALVAPTAVAFMALGAWWALTHPAGSQGVRVAAIPFAQTLYCLGWVLFLLRFYVSMEWISRIRVLDYLVSAVNARAVTIYLWANVGIGVATWTIGRIWPADVPWSSEVVGGAVLLSLVTVFLMAAVMGLGWVEDLAARRKPTLLPRFAAARQPGKRELATTFTAPPTPPPAVAASATAPTTWAGLVAQGRSASPHQCVAVTRIAPTAVEHALT